MKKDNKNKKKMPLWAKIPLIVISSIVGLFVVVWGGINIFKYAIYSDYYGRMTGLGNTPDLNDGFIPQGICISEEDNVYLMSGYVSKNPSRIYITGGKMNPSFETKRFDLYDGDKAFKGHVGGIATNGENVYICCNNKVFVVNLDYLLTTEETKIDLNRSVEVNNAGSFIFAKGDYIYVGEFHDGGAYITDHPYLTDEGMHYAIVEKYHLSDIDNNTGNKPVSVLSIRNKVQGFAIGDEGQIYLCTSYGLTDSIYYRYEKEAISSSDEMFLDDVPVYLLDGEHKALKAPAMAEGLDFSNGKIISYSESASNKYIFGKFFFANYFFSLDF